MSDRYDAGLLDDFGGGDVAWWQDYIRAELGRSEEFYSEEINRLKAELDNLKDALKVLMAWQVKNVNKWHNPAYDYAADVLKRLEAQGE